MANATILLLDDEIELLEINRDYLSAEGFDVVALQDGANAIELIRRRQVDLVLLDIMLPGADGISICKQIREFSSVPIIMLTAKVEEADRLLGLDVGADDYICKPAKPKEMIARVKALLRRTYSFEKPVKHSGITLDITSYKAMYNNIDLQLTPLELRVLKLLHDNPGRVFSRQQIIEATMIDQKSVTERTVDSHIKNIRKKLAPFHERDHEIIHSVYGVGYKLEH